MSIEREQPSTAFRPMPHIISFVKPQPIDELTGTFDAQMGELRSDHLTFKAQPINELTGEGRPMNVWTNGSATSFEDRTLGDYDANDAMFDMRENIDWTAANGGNGSSWLKAKIASKANAYVDEDVDGFMKLGDIKGEYHQTVHPDFKTGYHTPFGTARNRLGGNAGPGGSTFMTETFEPAAGMDSFGESLNPVLEIGTKWCPGGPPLANGQFEMPTDNIGGTSGPGGSSY